MENNKYTIAIMDEEPNERNKFINFFENDFNVIEITYVLNIDELIEKIKSEHIDAIAIDYKLKDHKSKFVENGDFFFKQLISKLQEFPSFVLTKDSEKAKKESKLIKPRFIIDKEILHSTDEKKVSEFLEEIKMEITSYKSSFDNKLARLKELRERRKEKNLDQSLENEYLILNNEISLSLTGYETLPMKYFSQETNAKLDEIISETNKLIRKISKRK